MAAPFLAVSVGMILICGPGYAALTLGEDTARSLGIHVGRLRALTVAAVAIGVGAGVAVAGAIGFVGLVAPHFVRSFVGGDPKRILIPAGLAGAALLTAADIAVRLIPAETEIRIGVLTAALGVPVFLYLVLTQARVFRWTGAMSGAPALAVEERHGPAAGEIGSRSYFAVSRRWRVRHRGRAERRGQDDVVARYGGAFAGRRHRLDPGRRLRAAFACRRARQMAYLAQGGDIFGRYRSATWWRSAVCRSEQRRSGSAQLIGTPSKRRSKPAICSISPTAALRSFPAAKKRARCWRVRLPSRRLFFVLDEPVAAFDPSHQMTAMRLLAGLAESGRTIIAILHDLALAVRFARTLIFSTRPSGRRRADRGRSRAREPSFGVRLDLYNCRGCRRRDRVAEDRPGPVKPLAERDKRELSHTLTVKYY